MTKEEFEQLKSTVKQWLFHTGSLEPTNYANELKLKFIEPKEKRIEELENANTKISAECHKLVDSLEQKQNRIEELEAQIEKMKNCGNCNGIIEGGLRAKKCKLCISSKDLPLWEVKEND